MAKSGLYGLRLNLDAVHEKVIDPIYANDFDLSDIDSLEELNSYLYTSQDGDQLSTSPSCNCRTDPIRGWGNIGIECNVCGAEVAAPEHRIDTQLWLRADLRINRFITPAWWRFLTNVFTTRKQQQPISYIQYFCDPSYRIPTILKDDNRKCELILESLDITRGWRNFCDNILDIVEAMTAKGMSRYRKGRGGADLLSQMKQSYDTIFCEAIPLPSPAVLVREKRSTAMHADTTIVGVIDGARTLLEIMQGGDLYSDKYFDSKIFAAMTNMSNSYKNYNRENLFKKRSIIRSALISGRMDPSGRAVITSITRPHDYRELELPWSVAITMYEKELCEWIMRDRGWSPTRALEYLNYHAHIYDEYIDKIFDYMIANGEEIPFSERANGRSMRGIPAILHRNPTLKIGSQQKLYITVVKSDTEDMTIGLSALILKSPNADHFLLH